MKKPITLTPTAAAQIDKSTRIIGQQMSLITSLLRRANQLINMGDDRTKCRRRHKFGPVELHSEIRKLKTNIGGRPGGRGGGGDMCAMRKRRIAWWTHTCQSCGFTETTKRPELILNSV